MSEQTQKIGFGYVDDTDDSLKTKSGGQFGLNQGLLTKFEYNPNAGADGAAANAIDITVMVEEREFRLRIYETTRVFDKDNNEIQDVNSPEYAAAYNADWKQKNAVIVHILKAFRTEEEIKQAFSVAIPDFKTFATIAQSLMPDNFQTKPIDVFLEYQWNISDGQDKTYLQLPKNMKGGYFFVPSLPGQWKEVIQEDGSLVYKNEAGAEHPFHRDKNFMEGNKANQQFANGAQPAGQNGPQAPTGGPASATSGTW